MEDTAQISVSSDEEYSGVINQNTGERETSKDNTYGSRHIKLNMPLVTTIQGDVKQVVESMDLSSAGRLALAMKI